MNEGLQAISGGMGAKPGGWSLGKWWGQCGNAAKHLQKYWCQMGDSRNKVIIKWGMLVVLFSAGTRGWDPHRITQGYFVILYLCTEYWDDNDRYKVGFQGARTLVHDTKPFLIRLFGQKNWAVKGSSDDCSGFEFTMVWILRTTIVVRPY
jgi:hypothetical protein